eukprot:TRINITY_DN4636_c0_g1_i2.p1 TRINITY_DN4636_c0_g1~~TRINITY_DN4636_c0_g1_i2.p1  ORF type:complete len:197 (+),score=89.62 TRINITY_DN4636_c0_g1_i2:52-591(+)
MQEQMTRLVTQLEDVEELKEDLDEDEYQETKEETIEQMKEFQESLEKLIAGDMSLVDDLGAMRLAIQAAVSQAFQTPEVISLFAKKQPGQLRTRLENMKRDVKLQKLSESDYNIQATEILSALKKLGEDLDGSEIEFLNKNLSANSNLAAFESVGDEMDESSKTQILSKAGTQIKDAQK